LLGLEYIGRTFGLSYTDIAKLVGVSPQYIQSGVKLDKEGNPRRKYSQKVLDKLGEIFHMMDDCYQRELTRIEELDVQLIHLENILESEESNLDKESLFKKMEELQNEQSILMILENTENLMKDEYEYYEQIISKLNLLYNFKSKKRVLALYTMLNILTREMDEIGNKEQQFELIDGNFIIELRKLLDQYSVLDDLKLVKHKIGYLIEVKEQIKSKNSEDKGDENR
jgi:hypothetical protein